MKISYELLRTGSFLIIGITFLVGGPWIILASNRGLLAWIIGLTAFVVGAIIIKHEQRNLRNLVGK